MLAACLCCRKKVPKNDLLGLEGMVKIKNPDDQIIITNGVTDISIDPNVSAGSAGDTNEKRVSNAPHRSLPDIPVSEPIPAGAGGDTGSDLYATVGDKVTHDKFPPDRNPNHAIRKLASISQHSSISQADDVSSPYARVKSPANHAYDKLRTAEHPYAQLTAANHVGPSTSSGVASNSTGTLKKGTSSATATTNSTNLTAEETSSVDGPSRRGSNESLLGGNGSHEDIPAASAIAGRISASQELPYMTPPIVQQPIHTQHFSGDSQDSSKGYTSISVREPLANIIAQTNEHNAAQRRRRDLSDSHYATVSDDSDEMYAAIEDPNQHHVDLYTSGSETYAQIQPPPNPNAITVAVEINNPVAPVMSTSSRNPVVDDDVMLTSVTSASSKRQSVISGPPIDDVPVPQNVDNLRTVHSRQASSSSCTSSVGNLGSPKPEKRQANSPLPPTPKNSTSGAGSHHHLSNSNLASLNGGTTSSIPSSRNSIASVIESQLASTASRHVSRENLTGAADGAGSRNSASLGSSQMRLSMADGKMDEDAAKKRNSAKNLEGMYAKVMKKNKLSNAPSPNTSPLPYRKSYNDDLLLIAAASTGASNPDLASTKPAADLVGIPANLSKSMIVPKSTNDYETIDQRHSRGNSGYDDDTRDPEYETIPADVNLTAASKANASNNRLSTSSTTAGLLAQGIHKVSHTSLAIFAEMDRSSAATTPHSLSVSPRINTSEPGYESLPDQSQRNQDPGYETVKPASASTLHHRNSVSTSDYDPNYEVLRHNTTGSRLAPPANESNYAHVWDPSRSSDDTTNDGYTKVKRTDSTVSSTNSVDYHDYAKISDRPQRNFVLSSSDRIAERDDEDDNISSDIYASISTVIESSPSNVITTATIAIDPSAAMFLNLARNHSDPNYSTISETRTGTATPGSTTAPTGIATSTSGLPSPGPSSTTKTTPSSDSSLTPIDYSSMRNSTSTTTTITLEDDRLTIGGPSTTYESLTGSESDPNYESVRYADSGAPARPENPYERLYSSHNADSSSEHPASSLKSATATNNNEAAATVAIEVGDYFQV